MVTVSYTSIYRVTHTITPMAGNFLVGCMTAAREYSLCTIGWDGEVAPLTVGPVCPSSERLRHLVLNLVCNTAETKTAFRNFEVPKSFFFLECHLEL